MDVGIQANVSYADPLVASVLFLWIVGAFGTARLPSYAPLAALFAALALGSIAINAVDPASYFSLEEGLVKFVKLLGSIAWFGAVYVLVRTDPPRFLATAATVSVAVASLFVLLAFHDAVFFQAHRQSGPFQNPNLFGNYLVFNACLGLYVREMWPAERWPWLDGAALVAVGVVASGILVTGSRGSLIAAIVVGGVVLVSSVEPSRRVGLYAVAVGAMTALASLVVVAVTAPSLAGRFLSTKNVAGRLNLWGLALDAYASSPLVGIGYGQFTQYHAFRGGPAIGAHNTYLLVASEIGVVGLGVLLALLLEVVRDALQAMRDHPEVLFVLAFLAGTAAQALVTDVDNFRSLWIAVGAVAAYQAHDYGRTYDPIEHLQGVRGVIDR